MGIVQRRFAMLSETFSKQFGTQMFIIAALWENMNPPFRALDEWDVFLDAINRKSISKTLLDFGLSKLDYQFIFISPQGASDIKYDISDKPKVSILEIKKN